MDYANKIEAYLTVEATMVLPIVLCSIYFTICSLFFRYDRCLMEQDVGILLLRGSARQHEETSFATRMQEQEASISKDKYVLWNQEGAHIELHANTVSVECNGRLNLEGIEIFECQTQLASRRINPALFIRSCNKLRGD